MAVVVGDIDKWYQLLLHIQMNFLYDGIWEKLRDVVAGDCSEIVGELTGCKFGLDIILLDLNVLILAMCCLLEVFRRAIG